MLVGLWPAADGDGSTAIALPIDCPTGRKVTGGGGDARDLTQARDLVLARSIPSWDGGQWLVSFMNSDGSVSPVTDYVTAGLHAVCIAAG